MKVTRSEKEGLSSVAEKHIKSIHADEKYRKLADLSCETFHIIASIDDYNDSEPEQADIPICSFRAFNNGR